MTYLRSPRFMCFCRFTIGAIALSLGVLFLAGVFSSARSQEAAIEIKCVPHDFAIATLDRLAADRHLKLRTLEGDKVERMMSFLAEHGLSIDKKPAGVIFMVFPDDHIEFVLLPDSDTVCYSAAFGISPEPAKHLLIEIDGQGV